MANKMTRVTRMPKTAQGDETFVEEQATGMQVEGSDVAIGAILAVAIPTVVYVLLSVSGLPVSRQEGLSYEEGKALREELLHRADPALSLQEFEERMQRTGDLVDRFVPKYRAAAQLESDPTVHQEFLNAAQTCLNRAQTELKELELATSKSAELRPRISEVQNRMNTISRLLIEVKSESKFKAVFESHEAPKQAAGEQQK